MSVQDRCTVCSERTIALEIILNPPDGSPTWRGSSEACNGPLGDNGNLDARSLHGLCRMYLDSENILDAPDDTPI
jgi:hypothetical protein